MPLQCETRMEGRDLNVKVADECSSHWRVNV